MKLFVHILNNISTRRCIITVKEFEQLTIKKICHDVIPVVRCKDCKYHKTGADYTDDFGEPLDNAIMCIGVRYGGVDPDWFCEHGERIGGNYE